MEALKDFIRRNREEENLDKRIRRRVVEWIYKKINKKIYERVENS
jgi:hypothetical protein